MTKEPFIQPRFVGARFEEHTLPLSAARDLAAYEELVIELAKHLFREKNQERERIPKGFASGFSLHLERVNDGSAKPAIVAMLAGALIHALPVEISEAKELVNAVIATEAGHPLPAAFPKSFYSYFNRVGRSLELGDSIEWTPDAAVNRTVLTPEKRKRLVLAHRETYQAEVTIIGRVEELDTETKRGTLRGFANEAVIFDFEDPFFADLKDALGNEALHVRIVGVGVFDVNDQLTSIVEIEQLDPMPHFLLISSIEEFANLPAGWLEGVGVAPDAEAVNWLTNEIAKTFPEGLEYPAVAPTEDGNVILEWIRPDARIELEANFAERQIELYSTNLASGDFVEQIFSQDEWAAAFARVTQLLAA